MTVGELKVHLDDYGDHVQVVIVTPDDVYHDPISVDPVTCTDGSAGAGIAF